MLKSPKRQQPQNNYKHIHMKNLNLGIKHQSQSANDKNMEYFPNKVIKRESTNYNLDISKSNTTNRESSQTSRYSKRQSNFTNSVQQQNRNIIKENQRLKRQLKRYEKILLEKDDSASHSKQAQLELIETYRVINYYQGKIKELQKICKQYEKQFEGTDNKRTKSVKVSLILEELRNSNSELKGKLQQKQIELQIITTELRKMESKFHNIEQRNLQLKKIAGNKKATSNSKFIDDYEQKNLNFQSEPHRQYFVKRRPQLSRSKKFLKVANKNQSDSDGSGVSSEYKNSVYIKRKQITSHSKEDQLRQSKQKSLAFGNISSRLNIIQSEIEFIKKENERLQDQLDLKVKEIIKLKEENQEQSIKIENTSSQETQQKELKTVTISKSKLREIQNPAKKVESSNLSQFVSNISMRNQTSKDISQNSQPSERESDPRLSLRQKQAKKRAGYTFSHIKERTLRKLTINIARQDISYFNLIQDITVKWASENPNSLSQLFQEFPFKLSSAETLEFVQEYKNIMKSIQSKSRQAANKDMNEEQYKKYVSDEIKAILKDNIAYFKNITIRRDFTLNIQLSNKFKNYEQQIEEIMKKYGNKLPISEWEKIFINQWGLTSEEALFLQIKNYEEYEDIDFIHIADLGKYFLLE